MAKQPTEAEAREAVRGVACGFQCRSCGERDSDELDAALDAYGAASRRAGTAGTDGAARIAAERQRQIDSEGYSLEHDASDHVDGDLAKAAACYALPESVRESAMDLWPEGWRFKADTRIRELEKAGALIAAEIDRLEQR